MILRTAALSNNWPHVPLGEAVEFLDHIRKPITASEREPGPYPYYGANGQQDSVAEFLFDEPLILLAEDGGHFNDPARGVAYGVTGKCWVNNHAHVLRPKEGFDFRFLTWHLAHYDVSAFVTGSTRAKLTKRSAERIQIARPPLDEQRRIAAILDKADAIRRKRREAIQLTEELLRSAFLEMFGDPVTNPNGWEVKPMAKVIAFLTSGSRGWAKYYSDAGRTFIRIQNVLWNHLDLTDIAYVDPPESAEARRTLVQPGDILLSITADLGRTAVVPEGLMAHINQHLALIRLKAGVEPTYVAAFLASVGGQRQFERLNRVGVKAGLNFNDVRSLQLLIPPPSLQRKFVAAHLTIRRSLRRQETAADEADNLFNSLVQRAFRGEL